MEGEEPRWSGVAKDGIPALTNPAFVTAVSTEAAYLSADDRVMGLWWDGEWVAVPLNILRYHEIVNLDGAKGRIAVTYCPLTGTGIVWDREAIGGAELGVSGLLWRNNLVMYDRSGEESLWRQMTGAAECGEATGTQLQERSVTEMTWEAWRGLHPNTRVVSSETDFVIEYDINLYATYERPDSPPLFEVTRDPRRQPKERVLGIPTDAGGTAIPFGVLHSVPLAAIHLEPMIDGVSTRVVVFWDREKQAAEAYYADPDWVGDSTPEGAETTFSVVEGRIVDDVTGSRWRIDGLATEGPAGATQLREVQGSMVAFWFAWAAFNENTGVLEALGGSS
ncbi:MAG: DUF3179 domain-containing protein [Gemmatimonadales bacterium]|nr:MAG: DUF3179 domain-containing protein [Gemmatimonadales bacterium]